MAEEQTLAPGISPGPHLLDVLRILPPHELLAGFWRHLSTGDCGRLMQVCTATRQLAQHHFITTAHVRVDLDAPLPGPQPLVTHSCSRLCRLKVHIPTAAPWDCNEGLTEEQAECAVSYISTLRAPKHEIVHLSIVSNAAIPLDADLAASLLSAYPHLHELHARCLHLPNTAALAHCPHLTSLELGSAEGYYRGDRYAEEGGPLQLPPGLTSLKALMLWSDTIAEWPAGQLQALTRLECFFIMGDATDCATLAAEVPALEHLTLTMGLDHRHEHRHLASRFTPPFLSLKSLKTLHVPPWRQRGCVTWEDGSTSISTMRVGCIYGVTMPKCRNLYWSATFDIARALQWQRRLSRVLHSFTGLHELGLTLAVDVTTLATSLPHMADMVQLTARVPCVTLNLQLGAWYDPEDLNPGLEQSLDSWLPLFQGLSGWHNVKRIYMLLWEWRKPMYSGSSGVVTWRFQDYENSVCNCFQGLDSLGLGLVDMSDQELVEVCQRLPNLRCLALAVWDKCSLLSCADSAVVLAAGLRGWQLTIHAQGIHAWTAERLTDQLEGAGCGGVRVLHVTSDSAVHWMLGVL